MSTAITDWVDSALQSGDRGQAFHALHLLSVFQFALSNRYYRLIFSVTQQALNLLLEFRSKSRLVQSTQDGSFTWVDDTLSKLGNLVLLVIGDNYQGGPIHHDTLGNQMGLDAVRAASQLPGKLTNSRS